MYHTILCATDLGSNSNEVLKKAIKFAKETNAQLVIAHVQPIVIPGVSSEGAGVTSTVVEISKEETTCLDSFKSLAVNAGVKDVKVVVEDSVNIVSSIVDSIAKTYKADLIVCGSSNTHGLTGFILGSVSSGIAKHAKCDVFVVKEKIEE